MWKLLLLISSTGMCGTLVENFFIAKSIVSTGENWALLLGFNEINWILYDASIMAYLTIKFEAVVRVGLMKQILRATLMVLFLTFAALRIVIGTERVRYNVIANSAITTSFANAFVALGIADTIVLALLVWSTAENLRFKSILSQVSETSTPRLSVVVINIFILSALAQTNDPNQTTIDFLSLAWAIKGTHPIILLFDLQSCKDRMSPTSESANSGKSSFFSIKVTSPAE